LAKNVFAVLKVTQGLMVESAPQRMSPAKLCRRHELESGDDGKAGENVAGGGSSSEKVCGQPELLVIETQRATLRLLNVLNVDAPHLRREGAGLDELE
jgi:hypothetical protein